VPVATLMVTPLTVTVGQTIAVTGASFGRAEVIGLYWDTTRRTALATAKTTGGVFTETVAAPNAVAGAHTLIAIGQRSRRKATATLTIQPSLILTPILGQPGARITARGAGFGAFERVTLRWATAHGWRLSTRESDTIGRVRPVTILIPRTVGPGTYRVYAIGTMSRAQATASLTVTRRGAAGPVNL